MTNEVKSIETTIELATPTKPTVFRRNIEFKSGEKISFEVPLKNISENIINLTLKDMSVNSSEKIIALLKQTFSSQHPEQSSQS